EATKKEEKPHKEREKPTPAEKRDKEKPVETGVSPEKEPPGRRPLQSEPRVKASPVARRIAGELGVDLASVKGTGPDGRVTETDVRAAAKAVAAGMSGAKKGPSVEAGVSPEKEPPGRRPLQQAGEGTRIQLSGMRRVIAQRLVESLGPVPHFYLNID